jgi:hypothetical protein
MDASSSPKMSVDLTDYVISQKVDLFITTAVRTTDPA